MRESLVHGTSRATSSAVLLVVSFAGAVMELGKLLHSQGLNYVGVSLVFLVPAAVIFASDTAGHLAGTMQFVARLGVLSLVGLGGAMAFQSIPYFFWSEPDASTVLPDGPTTMGGPRT